MSYSISIEKFDDVFEELEPLLKQHYEETCERLRNEGIHLSPYNPRWKDYSEYSRLGSLLTLIVRFNGEVVGNGNIYLLNDMHNNELNGYEDTIYITPEHRGKGIGKELVSRILAELKSRGIRRFYATPLTDPGVARLWERMGFKHAAEQMIYHF